MILLQFHESDVIDNIDEIINLSQNACDTVLDEHSNHEDYLSGLVDTYLKSFMQRGDVFDA